MEYYKVNMVDQQVSQLMERIVNLDKNEKIKIKDLLMSTRAYLQKGIYSEADLKDAADLIEMCVTWVPENRLTAK